jgi:hypothetical protein
MVFLVWDDLSFLEERHLLLCQPIPSMAFADLNFQNPVGGKFSQSA